MQAEELRVYVEQTCRALVPPRDRDYVRALITSSADTRTHRITVSAPNRSARARIIGKNGDHIQSLERLVNATVRHADWVAKIDVSKE